MATDKLVDFDHVTDYISRETAISEIMSEPTDAHYPSWYAEKLKQIPAADVVARDCYDRILAENDTMREMLARIGKKCGDSMDDVRPVVRARWEDETGYIFAGLAQRVHCPACKSYAYFYPRKTKNFCPTCGADMREPNLDTTKGDIHD